MGDKQYPNNFHDQAAGLGYLPAPSAASFDFSGWREVFVSALAAVQASDGNAQKANGPRHPHRTSNYRLDGIPTVLEGKHYKCL
jgi:hypothetical protein